MCNQNIISNKFDLKLVITFSSYYVQASKSLMTKLERQHDIQHNDTQDNDTQHKGLVCGTQHK